MSKNSKKNKTPQNPTKVEDKYKNELIKQNSSAVKQAYEESKRCLKDKDLIGAFLNCEKALELDPNSVKLHCHKIDILIAQHSKLAADLQVQDIGLFQSLQIFEQLFNEMLPTTSTCLNIGEEHKQVSTQKLPNSSGDGSNLIKVLDLLPNHAYRDTDSRPAENIEEQKKALVRDIFNALKCIKRLELGSDHDSFYNGCLQAILGQDSKAIEHFNKVIVLNSQYPNVYYKLGCSLERMGQATEAADAYSTIEYCEEARIPGLVLSEVINKAIKLNPNCTKAYLARGKYLYELGEYKAAERDFRVAIHQDPDNFVAYHGISCTLYQLKRYQEALVMCEEALRIDNNSFEVLSNKSSILLNLGQLQEALVAGEKALKIDNNNVAALFNQGQILSKLEQLQEALAMYQKALNLDRSSVTLPLRIAYIFHVLEQPNKALITLKTALSLAPNYTPFLISIGDLLLEQGEPDIALTYLMQALTLNSECAETHCNIGIALQQLGKPHEALTALEKALSLNQNDIRALSNKGLVLLDLEQPENTLQVVNTISALALDHIDSLWLAGLALIKLGQPEDALVEFNKVLKSNPKFTKASCGKGQALLALGKHKLALEAFKEVLNLQSKHIEAQCGIGQILLLNNPQKALKAFETALKWNPSHADAHVGKGQALFKLLEVKKLNNPEEVLKLCKEILSTFEEALKWNSRHADAYVGKGQALLKLVKVMMGPKNPLKEVKDAIEDPFQHYRTEAALEAFKEALQHNPALAEAYCGKGQALLALARHDEAYTAFKQALDYKPDYPEAHYYKGCTLLQLVKLTEGLPELSKPTEILHSGKKVVELFTEAYQEFKKLKDNPNYQINNECELICHRLIAYAVTENNHQSVIRWLKNALVVDSNNLSLHARLGKTLLQLAQQTSKDNAPNDRLDYLKEALKEFKLLASHSNSPSTIHYDIGTINLELAEHAAKSNQLEQAIQKTEQACGAFVTALTLFGAKSNSSEKEVNFSTHTLAAYSQLGVVLHQLATAIGERINLNKVRKIWEKADNAYENVRKFFRDKLQYSKEAIKLETMYLETLAHRGKDLLKLAEEAEKLNQPEEASKTYLEEARETFDTILDRDPDLPEAHHNLALVLHNLAKYKANHNELKEAVTLWEKAGYSCENAHKFLGKSYNSIVKNQ